MVLAARPVIPRSTVALVGAATAGRRPRNPYLRRDWLRVSQRLAAGMSPREVAHAERRDEAAIQGLLAQDGFRELVAPWEALAAKPPEEQTRQLVILARQAIHNALADWDVGAAFLVLREDERGRDPAVTLAKGVAAIAPPSADPPVPAGGPALPRSPAHPGDRLVERGAARLRRAVADELAVRRAAAAAVAAETTIFAPPPGGVAATVAAAKRALALKNAAGGSRPGKAAARPQDSAANPAVPSQQASDTGYVAAVASITGFPRRPRAP